MIPEHLERDPEKRSKGMGRVKETTKAFRVQDSLVETADESLEFPEWRAKAEKLKEATHENRPIRVFDAEAYRCLRASVVGGVFCHTLGYRGHYRSLYDGCRLLHNIKQDE